MRKGKGGKEHTLLYEMIECKLQSERKIHYFPRKTIKSKHVAADTAFQLDAIFYNARYETYWHKS